MDPATLKFFNQKHQDPILGKSDFINQIKKTFDPKEIKLNSEIPQKRQLAGEAVFERIIHKTAKTFSVPTESLFNSKRGRWNHPKLIALLLTKELSGLTLKQIAGLFHLKSYETVAGSCARCRMILAENTPLNKRYRAIYGACSQEEI